jgi:hypothetical protein
MAIHQKHLVLYDNDNPSSLAHLAAFPLALNVLPDYLSLLKTRYSIQVCRTLNSNVTIAGVLLLDLLGSALIASIYLGLFDVFMITVFPPEGGRNTLSLRNIWGTINIAFTLRSGTPPDLAPPLGVWFYSNFMASLWLWLYVLASLVLRLAQRMEKGVVVAKRVLDIERQPFMSLAVVCILMTSACYLFALLFVLFR